MADSQTPTAFSEVPVLLAGLSVGLTPLLCSVFAPLDYQLTFLVGGYLAAGLPFLFICLRWRSLGTTEATLVRLLLVALLVRLLLLFVPPILSEDLWRYIWDGHHIWDGVSPYALAPNAQGEDAFAVRNQLERVRGQIGHAHIPTVYPPTAQLTFALGTVWGPSVWWLRCIMIGADVITVAALWHWAAHLGRPPQVAALFAFAPLAVLESAVGIHVDSVGVAALTLGALLLSRGAELKAALATVWAIGIKWIPALLIIHWARTRWRHAAWIASLSAITFGLFFLAYPPDGSGLGTYAHRWRANDGVFALIYAGFESIWPNDGRIVPASSSIQALVKLLVGGEVRPEGVWPDALAFAWTKVAVGGLFGLSVLIATIRCETSHSFWLWTMGSLLLLSPVVHPWYLLWIMPCAIINVTGTRPYWGWAYILWSALICLAYIPRQAYLTDGVWAVPAWVPWVQYLPVFGVLCVAIFVRGDDLPVATEARTEEELDIPMPTEDG